jgi:hypothetical protein
MGDYFTYWSLIDTSVHYKLSNSGWDYPGASRGDMTWLWQNVDTYKQDSGWSFWKGDTGGDIALPPVTLTAGLNFQVPVYFNLSYSVPGYECWLWVCDGKTIHGNNSTNMSDQFVFDVFPATLEQFTAMNWDSRFTAQVDSDGDGVSNLEEIFRGMNPFSPDTDNDGVPDKAELTNGTNPRSADTDGDGISDHDELILGSDPTRVWMSKSACK